jgi:hypothetical protein
MIWEDIMTKAQFAKLVKQFDGWMEGDIARFPSVYQKEQFERALEQVETNSNNVESH